MTTMMMTMMMTTQQQQQQYCGQQDAREMRACEARSACRRRDRHDRAPSQ
jgi:hypothetical protein